PARPISFQWFTRTFRVLIPTLKCQKSADPRVLKRPIENAEVTECRADINACKASLLKRTPCHELPADRVLAASDHFRGFFERISVLSHEPMNEPGLRIRCPLQ